MVVGSRQLICQRNFVLQPDVRRFESGEDPTVLTTTSEIGELKTWEPPRAWLPTKARN